MKALTLHQPWAWLVANGLKEVETRSWYTSYCGPLAIHAGRKRDLDGRLLWIAEIDRTFLSTVSFDMLPFGAVVATCNLVACVPTALITENITPGRGWAASTSNGWATMTPKRGWDVEKRFGNYAPGRWAWILRDVVAIEPPIPVHGWQRLWNWTPPATLSAETGLRP